MNRVRVWILGAALGSFAAGMNVGLAIPEVFAARGGEAPEAEQAYVRDLAAKYGLSSAQERTLRLVMQSGREEEIAVWSSAEPSQLPPQIQSRILAARSRTEQRIRALLDEGQRARYDLESRPRNNR